MEKKLKKGKFQGIRCQDYEPQSKSQKCYICEIICRMFSSYSVTTNKQQQIMENSHILFKLSSK